MFFQAIAPPFTTFFGWLVPEEILTLTHHVGMFINLLGIGLVVLVRSGDTQSGTSLWGLGFHFPDRDLAYFLLKAVD